MKKVIIVGAGSVGKFLAYNVKEFTSEFEFIGFLDDDIKKQNQTIAGLQVLGTINKLPIYIEKGFAVVWGIAFPKVKSNLVESCTFLNADFPSFISKSAWISDHVSIGKGCIVYPGSTINYETVIGNFVIINMNCAIGHNSVLNDFVSLSPGVNLGGYTQIGKKTQMGINSSTKQYIIIGSDCVIGGQSIVVENVKDNITIKGVPAK